MDKFCEMCMERCMDFCRDLADIIGKILVLEADWREYADKVDPALGILLDAYEHVCLSDEEEADSDG